MHKTKKRILVADDDEDILAVMEMMLQTAGYNVTTMLRGEDVLELKDNLPDLILLDIWMAGISGRDICIDLKNKKLTKHIPVILVSANRDTEDIAIEAGADDFICKPFDMQTLLEKAKKYLN